MGNLLLNSNISICIGLVYKISVDVALLNSDIKTYSKSDKTKVIYEPVHVQFSSVYYLHSVLYRLTEKGEMNNPFDDLCHDKCSISVHVKLLFDISQPYNCKASLVSQDWVAATA